MTDHRKAYFYLVNEQNKIKFMSLVRLECTFFDCTLSISINIMPLTSGTSILV